MNEEQLNAILGTIREPIQNKYCIDSYKQVAEIQRIIKINEEQKIKHKLLSIKNLAMMKVVFSNN